LNDYPTQYRFVRDLDAVPREHLLLPVQRLVTSPLRTSGTLTKVGWVSDLCAEGGPLLLRRSASRVFNRTSGPNA
jgi:hypothetical protein